MSFIEFDHLDRVDGSARFGFGQYAQALASVSGPIEVRLATEQASQAALEVIVRPLSNVSGTSAKFLGNTIATVLTPSLILTQNPRTLIQIVTQSLWPVSKADDTFNITVASMINASTLALINAGSLPMRGLVCAVASAELGGCFAFLFGQDKARCVWANTSGTIDLDTASTVKKAELAALQIWQQMKDAVRKKEGLSPLEDDSTMEI